jgi:hypothetical protein
VLRRVFFVMKNGQICRNDRGERQSQSGLQVDTG